ncbi:acetolactate synthase large subunit [Pikeienuella piscinae]|uniref:Acetolactate synthase large subunit n=1 Tax=Pikeienuella piscinae TaxID=2748098 RepID=A0A7L5C0P8_9RHOB|nr:acetolactate synthase large subunit [Pikeienuella piscinae]QIE56337.1 acetolactate synthase large subunit [Pikeienuella piscinae]
MNGAESLVRTLLAAGVDHCFTNPGTSEMHFVAALDGAAEMRSVLALQEGVATGAADGYWRMAGRPASTLLHLGPGLANGLSNLHNAKKAGSGVVNIVGEHATAHIALDAPLTADIEGIARPVSDWVRTTRAAADVGADAAAAVRAASGAAPVVATLILPGDAAWSEGGVVAAPEALEAPRAVPEAAVTAAAEALRKPGALLLLGPGALDEAALADAGRISAATGCGLMTEWSNARLARGAGIVAVARVPYPVDQAVEVLRPYRRIVLAGAKRPVAFFAYPDKPGVLTQPGTVFDELGSAGDDIAGALRALVEALGAGGAIPKGIAAAARPAIPEGAATPESIAAVLGATLPEGAVVVDEGVTTGRGFFGATAGAPPHHWLNNRGGSIGYGMPVAIGAAMAAPGRKVIALVGDGSAMYTPQALWTMAREGLDVTVLIFANRNYAILRGELTNVGVANPGPRALSMLSLDHPALEWTHLARGMGVEAERVETAPELAAAVKAGLASEGPYLVEVMI